MKKLMFASLALLGSVALANAQEAQPQESNQATEAVTPAPAPEATPAPAPEATPAPAPEAPVQDAPAVQETPAVQDAPAAQDQDDKTKIKSEELPEAVKKALEAQEYRGWLIDAAYHVKSTDSYEVQLKNGAETKSVKFDKDGKIEG